MPRYDFKCVNGHVREDVWVSMFRDAQHAAAALLAPTNCEECGCPMLRQFPAPNFSVGGFNAKNGYSHKDS